MNPSYQQHEYIGDFIYLATFRNSEETYAAFVFDILSEESNGNCTSVGNDGACFFLDGASVLEAAAEVPTSVTDESRGNCSRDCKDSSR